MAWKNKQLIVCIGCGDNHMTWRPDKTRYCSIKCARKFQPKLIHTEESKRKIRETNLKTWSNPEIRQKIQKENHPNWGKSYQSGKQHWNWKGGITPTDRAARVKFRRELQLIVFERDNYTCQICDQYSGYLQVDHIKKWSEYPELRFDLDNCRTLCMACHYYITFKRKMPLGTIWGHNLSRRIG